MPTAANGLDARGVAVGSGLGVGVGVTVGIGEGALAGVEVCGSVGVWMGNVKAVGLEV